MLLGHRLAVPQPCTNDMDRKLVCQLSRAAAKEMQAAINRHTESLIRATDVVPSVRELFEKEIAAIMKPK